MATVTEGLARPSLSLGQSLGNVEQGIAPLCCNSRGLRSASCGSARPSPAQAEIDRPRLDRP
ncbi:hypothetical protein, partial [Nodosilinea sp. LEGE 07088]|uniref:hypothetical protein n=1 Tax=Nodosilinea sp. LEGE 07088 TaxID=2777968 RepID=UPI0018800DAF